MAKLIGQMGPVTVVVKDDRAVLKGKALREWKDAVTDLLAGAAALITESEYEEEAEDDAE